MIHMWPTPTSAFGGELDCQMDEDAGFFRLKAAPEGALLTGETTLLTAPAPFSGRGPYVDLKPDNVENRSFPARPAPASYWR